MYHLELTPKSYEFKQSLELLLISIQFCKTRPFFIEFDFSIAVAFDEKLIPDSLLQSFNNTNSNTV
jgi:hypothetical protein